MQSDIINNSEEKNFKDSCCNEESLNLIFKDAVKYAPSKIIGAVINLAIVSLYTNLLSPKEYGLYMVVTSVISFLAIIFSDWIGISALRFFREHFHKDNLGSYFSTLFFLLVINLTIMYTSSFIFFKPLETFFKIPAKFLLIVLILIIPIAIRALFFQILRAQIKPLTYTFSVIFNQIVTAAITTLLITQFHLGVVAVLIGMAVSIITIDIIMFFQTKYYKAINHGKIHYKTLSGLYKYGIPVALSSLGMWLITQSNRFILQYFKGSYYNGQLGVGYNLTYSIMLPLFSIINLAAIPRIINSYEENKNVKPVLSRLTELYFIWFLPITFFLCIYPKEIVLFFANSNFINAYILIPFLSLSAFCLGLTELTTIQYYLVKKTKIDMTIRLVSGGFGIILNIILLPHFGLLAIGFSCLLSQILYFVLSCIIKIKEINWIFPIKSVLKTSIVLIICFIISVITRNIIHLGHIISLLIHAVIFFGSYIALISSISYFSKKIN